MSPTNGLVVTIPQELLDVSNVALPETIKKRDGRIVPFTPGRISQAIERCFAGINRTPNTSIDELTYRILNAISGKNTPDVEGIQNLVEVMLMSAGEFEAAKAYVLYRAEHARLRAERPVPLEVQEAFASAKEYFPTALQEFQFFDKYSRFDYDKGRRETWPETVDRSVDFLQELVRTNVSDVAQWNMLDTFVRIRKAILSMRAMPSMRLLAMAGPAARRQHATCFNCSFIPVDSIDSFAEALLLSMSGAGVGFSVERHHVIKLGKIEKQRDVPLRKYVVEDSTEGWVDAIRHCFTEWFIGRDIEIDYSQIRPSGSPLRVKGGRASGPDPLRNAMAFTREKILSRQGSYLRPLDAHDIMMHLADAAVSGGVRRSAMISLFDIDDEEMARCKVGDFETHSSSRWNANNSAIIPTEGISQAQFLKLWNAMVESGRGEPGIVSRQAMKKSMWNGRLFDENMGTNPCGEITLRPLQLCNLSIAVARQDDTLDTLLDKVEIATIIGTIQSLMTHFPGLRPEWAENQRKERLLGVDITGQRDCPLLQDPNVFAILRERAETTNRLWSSRFGINCSAAITTVKPSGNSAVLLDCSSGIHGRWAPYYEKNVRVSATSPMYKVLRDSGVPLQPENGQETSPEPSTFVASFVVKSPEGTPTRNDLSAIDQAEYWLHVKKNWTHHNPSCTITYKPEEIIPLMTWVWSHIEDIGGLSFLPASDIKLAKLPYIEIDKETYEARLKEFPVIDFAKIFRYEHDDRTTAAQELACSANGCEI